MMHDPGKTTLLFTLAAVLLVTGLGAVVIHPDEVRHASEMLRGTTGTSGPWSVTDVVSTESTGSSYNPSLAVDAGGNVHVAWYDTTDYAGSGPDTDIFYKRWDAATRTWSVTEVVSTESTGSSYNPSLAVDAGGNVHVAWHDTTDYAGSGIDTDIFYKRWDTATRTWSVTEVVSTESTSSSNYPSLAVDAGGNVHVAWHDDTDYAGSGIDWDIFYKCKPAGGAWPAATVVISSESTGSSQYPSLAVDAGCNVHVSWDDNTNYGGSGSDIDIFYKYKLAGGAWPAATEVISTESTSNSQYPSLAVDAGGNVHVTWEDYTNYAGSGTDWDIFYKCKSTGGAWPAETEVISTESTSNSYNPSLMVDAGGNVHATWQDNTDYAGSGPDPDIFYKCKPAGGAWPAVTEVVSTESTGNSYNPSLMVDAGGNVHATWQDYTDYAGSGTDIDIFYKVIPRVPAVPVLNPVTPGISSTGIIDLIWLQSDGASWYFVYRETQPIKWVVGLVPIARIVTGRSFADKVTANGTWFYAVVAGNAYYNSTVSNCVAVVVAIPPASSTAGTIPESAFYLIVGAMALIAILALVAGFLAGRRGAARAPARARPSRDDPPALAPPAKTP
nr:hypothetical protein [Candidatus Sigynarchaeum springense]